MKRPLVWIGVPLLLITAACSGVAYWAWCDMQMALDRRIFLHEYSELFEIERGTSVAEVARRMHELGWLTKRLYLRLEARRLGIGSQLKAGIYEIYDGTSPRKLLNKFVHGEVKIFIVTFIEGSIFSEMRNRLESNRHLRQTAAGKDAAWIMARLGADPAHAEGRFFPSTYHFSAGDSDIDILRRAHAQMVEILAFHWRSRAPELPYNSPDDALIMASIIEKETAREDERAQIAGVFVERLRRGMKLQTDPTVIYGMGAAFDGNLRRRDLQRDTAYNTYTRYGLPPTPIAMPGEDSIRAALHPTASNFLYFVGRGDGSHQFSATLREHNVAVRRYQLSALKARD